jgi:hypothetical protein
MDDELVFVSDGSTLMSRGINRLLKRYEGSIPVIMNAIVSVD